MNDVIITPANIISVVIQYKPNNTYPQGLFSNPSIVVAFDNSGVTQYQQIDLNQVLTYIKMLELKAAINAVGEVVLAIQSTPDGEQFTKITIGQPVTPPAITGTINFKVDGVNFAIGNALSNIANATGAGVADRGIDNTPFIVEFSLPQFTDDFFTDYLINTTADIVFYQALGNGTTWDVTAAGIITTGGAKTIEFTTQSFIKFVTTGLADKLSIFDANTGNFMHSIITGGETFYLPSVPLYNFRWNNTFDGSMDVSQYIAGVLQPATVFVNIGMFDVVTLAGDEIHLDKSVINVSNNQAGNLIAQEFFVSTEANKGYIEMLSPPHISTDLVKETTTNPIYYNIIPSVTVGSYFVDILDRLGNILETFPLTASGTQQNFVPSAFSAAWETLRFYFVAGGTGVPIQAAAGNVGTSAALCPATLVTYYTASGTLTTGDTVFTDAALTTPLAGNTFILSPDGNIYAIDVVTGVVGAASGNSCNIPISGKNMQVVGTASTHFAVDGVDVGAHGAGSNYNMVIKSDSVITNNVGAGRTLNFYTTPPFIGANLTPGSGSPVAIANAGTYTLPTNIANYNYVVVT